MNGHLKKDPFQFDNLLETVRQQGVNVLQSLHEGSTTSSERVGVAALLQDTGMGAEDALRLFNSGSKN